MTPEYLDIPLFPLPNVTFFPKTFLPLHVFEPRYRRMIANCLNGDRMLGVTLLKEGWQRDYFGRPPVCKSFGVGKIIDYDQLDNGCYNIVLEGLYRVRLIEEFSASDYRVARVQVLQDPPIDGIRKQVSEIMREMNVATEHLMDLMPQMSEMIAAARSSHTHPLVIADQLVSSIVMDAYERQSILEQDDPIRRLHLLLIQMRNMEYQLDPNQAMGSVEGVAEEDELPG
jgi:Lon protease-like protein